MIFSIQLRHFMRCVQLVQIAIVGCGTCSQFFLGAQDISKLFKKQSNKNTQTTNQSIPKKSFPSSHITSVFSVRLLFASAMIRLRDLPYATAAFIGYSQIKVDKHYFRDVLAGRRRVFYTWTFANENTKFNVLPIEKDAMIGYKKEF